MTLAESVASYVAFKRATGLSFKEPEQMLDSFAAQAAARGERFVCAETALAWASQAASPRRKHRRLQVVRGLAVYLHAEDQRHEIPHRDALGRATQHRPPPRLLTLPQVCQLMQAALELPPAGSITPVTFHYLIGLLAATGLRRAEATGLQLEDATPDGLRVRNAKFGRTRLVPLHASVRTALDRYLQTRLQHGSSDEHLFILASGGPGEPGPRLHDLRHSFAMRALEGAVSGDRKGISRHMLALSTYLGHSDASNTYWYLEATPVLLNQVSAATERLHELGGNDG